MLLPNQEGFEILVYDDIKKHFFGDATAPIFQSVMKRNIWMLNLPKYILAIQQVRSEQLSALPKVFKQVIIFIFKLKLPYHNQ